MKRYKSLLGCSIIVHTLLKYNMKFYSVLSGLASIVTLATVTYPVQAAIAKQSCECP